MEYYVTLLIVSVAFWTVAASKQICAEEEFADSSKRQIAIELSDFIQVPGPNPILRPDPRTDWDDENIEAADAFEDSGTYYLYYHAVGSGGTNEYQYQIGVASATNPLGPFKKHGVKPILPVGPKGSWDESSVACPVVLKEGDEKYYMWYGGRSRDYTWDIGLATASHPLGPWRKYEDNPILKDFGYIGGVVKHGGKYRIYSMYPLGPTGYHGDYGPLAVAIAEKREGPYVKYKDNPLMVKGASSDWDSGGFSEAEVLYHNGMYHMFYGGTSVSWDATRLESIGYAYSFDGFKWYKYGKNPVVSHKKSPIAYAFAEVHSIIELPYIYVYHTLKPESYEGRSSQQELYGEHLGVHVLVTQKSFSIDMPVLYREKLEADETTKLSDVPPICLGNITQLSLTVACVYGQKARKPIRIHVRSSYDGLNYDTTDLYTLYNVLQPGQLARKTFQLDSKTRFMKVMVENLDDSESVSDVQITAILGR